MNAEHLIRFLERKRKVDYTLKRYYGISVTDPTTDNVLDYWLIEHYFGPTNEGDC